MAVTRRETGRGFAVADSTPAVLTASAAETTLFSGNIPAGYMGTTKELHFKILCTLDTPALSIPTITVRLKFGASTLSVMPGLTLAANRNDSPFLIEGMIANTNSTAAQIVFCKLTQVAGALLNAQPMAYTSWAENTTSDKLFAITVQFGGLNINTSLTFRHASVELT